MKTPLRSSVAVLALAFAATPLIAYALPSADSPANSAIEAFLTDEAQRSPAGDYDFVSGYFLDDAGKLVARTYADGADAEQLAQLATQAQILASQYTQAEISLLESKLAELAQAPGSGGFFAEYDARQDLYVITGKVDPNAVAKILGDATYSIVQGEPAGRFSR